MLEHLPVRSKDVALSAPARLAKKENVKVAIVTVSLDTRAMIALFRMRLAWDLFIQQIRASDLVLTEELVKESLRKIETMLVIVNQQSISTMYSIRGFNVNTHLQCLVWLVKMCHLFRFVPTEEAA